MQPLGTTQQQHEEDTIDKSCKEANAYDDDTLNGVSIENVNLSIRRSFCNYWATPTKVDLTNIAFQAESLLAMHKGCSNQPIGNQQQIRSKLNTRKPGNNQHGANDVIADTASPHICS